MKKLWLLLLIFLFPFFVNGQNIYVSKIFIVGNYKTKAQIVLRELTFKVGDSINKAEWETKKEQSINNLINTSLFHSCQITMTETKDSCQILIELWERWYLWPTPQFTIDERNFNTWLESKSFARASVGVFINSNNTSGRNDNLKLLFMVGYNQRLGISYEIPYINKKKTIGIGVQSIFSLKHEVNSSTEFDRQAYLKTKNKAIQTDWINGFSITYRPKHFLTHQLQIQYHQWLFADTLIQSNPYFSQNIQTSLKYFSLNYKIKIDKRDYKSYPLKGYYADIEANKYGLGLIKNDVNIFYLKTTLRKYDQLSTKWFIAECFIAKKSTKAFQSYLLEQGLGYGRDFIRGYEYYVIDGQDYIVGKTNIKYSLLQKKYFPINWLKTYKFNNIPLSIYVNAFSDFGFVSNKQTYSATNTLPNTWLYSIGLGLDFVTYYDKVMRLEFTSNGLGKSQFYIHFIAPL